MSNDATEKRDAFDKFLFVIVFTVFIVLWLIYFPYRLMFSLARLAWAGRDELLSHAYADYLAYTGQPVPNPLLPADEMRRLVLDQAPNPDLRISDVELFALERAYIQAGRVGGATALVVGGAILTVLSILCWHYVWLWVAEQIHAHTLFGGSAIAAVALWIAGGLTGWIALGITLLVYNYGPQRWFRNRVDRQSRPLHGDDTEPLL